jgi:hypothetical protein
MYYVKPSHPEAVCVESTYNTHEAEKWYLCRPPRCCRMQTHDHSQHLIVQHRQGARARVMCNFASTIQLSPTQHIEAAPSNRLSERSRKANVSNKSSSPVPFRLSLPDPDSRTKTRTTTRTKCLSVAVDAAASEVTAVVEDAVVDAVDSSLTVPLRLSLVCASKNRDPSIEAPQERDRKRQIH